jgi:hypothetical protein
MRLGTYISASGKTEKVQKLTYQCYSWQLCEMTWTLDIVGAPFCMI